MTPVQPAGHATTDIPRNGDAAARNGHLPHPSPTPPPAAPPPGGRLAQGVLAVLAFSFVFWNLLLLFLMCWLMPKNDFGRTFYSVVAFLRGQDMYAMNAS